MINIRHKKLKGYKFIDLFCGIGGFNLALTSFGAKCVFASDIDKQAIETYEKNFSVKVSGDITQIEPKDIPNHDIICAGFPDITAIASTFFTTTLPAPITAP